MVGRLTLTQLTEVRALLSEHMNFKTYQKQAATTMTPAATDAGIVYLALGLNGEAGEVAEKVKKIVRDQGGELTDFDRTEIGKELGDVLWYLAMLAEELGVSLEEVAQGNINKLISRKERGVIHGSGDNR